MDAAGPAAYALATKAARLESASVNLNAMRMSVGQMDVMAYAGHVKTGNPAKQAHAFVFQIAVETHVGQMGAGIPVASWTCAGCATETTPRVWDVMAFQTVGWSSTSARYAMETEPRASDVMAFQTVGQFE